MSSGKTLMLLNYFNISSNVVCLLREIELFTRLDQYVIMCECMLHNVIFECVTCVPVRVLQLNMLSVCVVFQCVTCTCCFSVCYSNV